MTRVLRIAGLDGSTGVATAIYGALLPLAHAPVKVELDDHPVSGRAQEQPPVGGLSHPQAGPSRPMNGHSSAPYTWFGHDRGKHEIDGSKGEPLRGSQTRAGWEGRPGAGANTCRVVAGLVPVIGKLLEKSHAAGKTHVAYLCDPAVTHVARGLIDVTWGCG